MLVPAQFGHFRLEAGVAIQIELLSDRAAVRKNLRRAAVLLLRHVTELLQQRQVDVRLDIAGRTGVAVPVPGAAEVAALFDQPDVFDVCFAQSRAGQQTAEPATDHHHIDVVGQRLAMEARRNVRILDELREVADNLDVLLVAVVAEPLVTLRTVPRPQLLRVEREILDRHRRPLCTTHCYW